MAKKEKVTALALGTQFSVSEQISILEEQIAKLEGNSGKKASIDVSLGDYGRIQDIKESKKLIEAYMYITNKAIRYKETLPVFEKLNPAINVPEFTEEGFSLEEWQEFIKASYLVVTNSETIDQLKELKNLLESNLSEEEKRAKNNQLLAEKMAAMQAKLNL